MTSIVGMGKGLFIYLRETGKMPRDRANPITIRDLISLFSVWLRSRASTPLEDGRPWLTFHAIQFLEQFLQPDMTVFEYGSGGSTLFFARRAGRVISVEHDEAWFQRVAQAVKESGLRNSEMELIPPLPLDQAAEARHEGVPGRYLETPPHYPNCHFEPYVRRIDTFADDSLDVVVLDGRARVSCLGHAYPKVRRGGLLVLDNSEREAYAPIHARMETSGWKKRRFFGPGPYNVYFWETTIWQRPTS